MADDRESPPRCTLRELERAYDGLLLDAYGVLNDARGALPGARALIDRLTADGPAFWVVTNGAARLPEAVAQRFASFGLAIPVERIVTSGDLLAPWFAEAGLGGARTAVLGTADSCRYVERAGGDIVALTADAELDVLVLADESGYDFLPMLDLALTVILAHVERGACPRLCLPNPDLIYPSQDGGFGFTAGAAAMLLEAAVERRCGVRLAFERLGKPYRPIFDEAIRRAGSRRLLMIGDQLETDIAGARAAGLDAALLETGVSTWQSGHPVTPTFLLSSLA
ncbi:MAG TPA: HAD-IA family hydrolase [Kofleriaceae bacterium]|nr:HAD-IA family hydrolase [Kofleriaceae bacterium]